MVADEVEAKVEVVAVAVINEEEAAAAINAVEVKIGATRKDEVVEVKKVEGGVAVEALVVDVKEVRVVMTEAVTTSEIDLKDVRN